MIPLYDVTEEIGGLEVCPETHLDTVKENFKKDYPSYEFSDNFLVLSSEDKLQGTGKLLLAKAGDLILWDSRTVHGGRVGT
jgi:ectoine hydroxylase-related dioxygenase (phytanoyl-CoA dioxygenase family)